MTEESTTHQRTTRRRRGRFLVPVLLLAGLGAAALWIGLPYLAGAPERDLARADQLRLAGDIAAAHEAFEAAFVAGTDWDRLATAEVRSARTEVGIDAGTDLEAAGRHPEAEAIYRRVLATADTLQKVELHWRLARCREAAGDPVGSAVEVANVQLLRARHGKSDLGLLDRMGPALSDPEDPGHAMAMSRFSEAPGDWLPPPPSGQALTASEWRDLAARGDRAIPRILGTLEDLSPAGAPEERQLLRCAVAEAALVGASELEIALAGYAAGEDRPVYARTIAAELLCRVAELPRWREPGAEDGADPAFVRQAVALWHEGHGLEPGERLRRQIEALVARDARVLDGTPGDPAAAWFRAATGAPVTADLRSWWTSARSLEPADRLAGRLGFGDSAKGLEARRVLERYHGTSRLERRSIHQLLRLIARPDTVIPTAGFSALSWPDGRSLDHTGEAVGRAWNRALSIGETPPAWQVRTAAFVYRDRGSAPMLLWESVRPARVGDTIAHHDERRIEFERMPARFRPSRDEKTFGLPGDLAPALAPDGPPDGGATVQLRTAAVLRVDPGDGRNPVLTWLAPEPESAPASAGLWYVSHHVIGETRAVDGAPRPLIRLLLASLEPREEAAAPRGMDWWLDGPAHNFARYMIGAEKRSNFANALLFGPVYDMTIPAVSLLWNDAAHRKFTEVLRLEDGPATDEVYAKAVAILQQMSRLGNDQVETDEEKRFTPLEDIDLLCEDRPFHTPELRHRFWEALMLETTRRDVFDHARDRLIAGEYGTLPLYLQNDLNQRGLALGARVPEHVIEAIRRIDERRPDLGGLIALGGILLLALVAAMRPWASLNSRLRPASVVVVIGVALAGHHLVYLGHDLRIEVIGFGIAALGASVLARSVAGPHRWLPTAGFLIAAASLVGLGTALRLAEGPCNNLALDRLATIRNGALAVGFAGLPLLSWMMIREFRLSLPRKTIRRLAAVGAILGVLGIAIYWLLPTLSGREPSAGSRSGLIGEAAAVAGMLALAYALHRKRTYPGEHELGSGRGGKRWPRPIRAMGSPPALLIGLGGAIALTNGTRNFMFREDWFGASPALWIVMSTMLLCLLLSANRAANVPSPIERLLRLFERN